jgi:hypothetical protein
MRRAIRICQRCETEPQIATKERFAVVAVGIVAQPCGQADVT